MDPKSQPNIPPIFLKPYDPANTEDRIYKAWLDSGYFNPDNLPPRHKEVFSIVLPPPNVTGTLHMGHALMLTLEDVMVRYARMQGKKTLWLPGTDHAAIATQSKVEGIIYKEEGKRRHDLGREAFLERVDKYAQDSHDTIISQTKRMGASLDWSREAYTLDEKRNLAVRTAFKKMYDDGIIYRGYRVVNWDPKGQTTISDDEIVYTAGKAKFYTFRYSKDFPISIATTRPETKVGDVAVAVHPSDERYKQFVGREYDIDFAGEKIHIKIVADESVDPAFGTGALGVTPAHSQVDYDIAQRHSLPIVPVINEYAKMSVKGALLAGKKTTEARELVATWLRENGLMEKEEDIEQNLSTAERTGGIVEPLPKLQWFIDVNKKIASRGGRSLKDLMQSVVTEKQIAFIPDRFERVYTNWIGNLRDWCISRQIWFGHRIPVWYRESKVASEKSKAGENQEIYCGLEAPTGLGWVQDEDTLDTWFSSGLWTFSTLGWPENTEDFKKYHPTTILETGYDIIFFWVARMILMSTYLLDTVPFKTVYLNGLVRNKDGSKMSKSSGAVDPLTTIDKYGADALRMSLIIGTGPGNDSKTSDEKLKAYKNFANKIWNITRFVLSSTEGYVYDKRPALGDNDARLVEEFDTYMTDVERDMNEYRYHLAGEKLYAYVWHTFADVIIEASKPRLASSDHAEKASIQWTLLYILERSIRALHPFMPYVTEEIWIYLPLREKRLLMIESWNK
jgi:valyl-tRNA synthetase